MGRGAQDLSDVTRSALWHGLCTRPPWRQADRHRRGGGRTVRGAVHDYGIVREYVGHGIGTQMHMPPDVPNVGPAGKGPRLVPGLVVAVEPMVTLGARPTT